MAFMVESGKKLLKLPIRKDIPKAILAVAASGAGGLKPLGGLKPIAPPAYDDEDILLPVSKAEGGGNATANFLASMLALQQ